MRNPILDLAQLTMEPRYCIRVHLVVLKKLQTDFYWAQPEFSFCPGSRNKSGNIKVGGIFLNDWNDAMRLDNGAKAMLKWFAEFY
jgi:hypothetical protein